MNKVFRKIHLWLSVPVGLIITVICLTGAALVFERDVTESLDPELYKVPDSLELLSLQLPGERDGVCMATFKGTGKRSLSVNPYTGEVNGWTKSYPFFQTMRKLHRWLMDPPAYKGAKSAGKVIVGVTTLVMVVILVSGVAIWVPRTRKALKNRLLVSCTKGWRRFWYDSHVSLGIYATLFLLAMSAPQQRGKEKQDKKPEFDYAVWDAVVSELQVRYSSYASISLTAGKAQVNKPGNMRSSDTAAFDARTGEITSVTAYDDIPRAQKMKGWFYAFHTGSWGGMTTKALYFLAAFIGGILPLSGYYLWLKKKRRPSRKKAP